MRRTRLNSSAQTVTFSIPTTLNFTDMDSVDLISAFAGSTVFDRTVDVEGVKLTAKDGAVVVTIPDYVMDWHHNDSNYVQQVEEAVKQWLARAGTVKDNTRFADRIVRDSVNSARLNSSSNLMFSGLGNGLTVYDRSHKDGNDYLEIAHITTSGMIKYYADVNDEERTAINKRALLMQDEWLNTYGQDYGSTADAQRRLKEAQKDAYNYGYEYPDNVAANSSRLPVKTQRAIRHCINSARRRAGLNCSTRYSTKYRVKPNGDTFTLYFISDDELSNAVFDVDPDFQGACNVEGEILGADANWEIDSYENWFNSSESRDIYELLRYDAEGSTGVDMHECSEADYNASCIAVEQAKKQLNSARRLNSGKLFYDDATGEYEEYEYDDEQDAWYQLPDEMYIYKLDLSQFTDLVRDGIVSKHEIHEWIDELSEDWGGMPAWSPSKLIDRFEIQDLTKEQYNTWKANFATESVRFRDELERRY